MKHPRFLPRAVLTLAGALLLASPAHAIDPFEVSISVGPADAHFSISKFEDVIDQLDPAQLSDDPNFTAVNPATDQIAIDLNFRGITTSLFFATNSNTLDFGMDKAGISESFVGQGANARDARKDALEQLFDYLKKNKRALKSILTALARYSPIDPLAGNPDSLFSRRMKSDMDHGFTHKVSQVWGCGTSAFNMTNDAPILVAAAGPVSDIFEEAQERAAELQAGNEIGIGVMYTSTTAETAAGDYKSTGFLVPLSYTAKLDFNLNPLVGELAMSPAVNFHARIYRERPDVHAIVHLHSHYLSVLSSVEGKQVEMFNVHSVLFHDEQATYFDDGVKSHLEVVDALGDKRVCLMKNHGAIVASDSLENATIEAITLEKSARIQLECEAIGGTPIIEAEVVSGKAMYRTHYLPQMWAANVERLRRSDPDLFS